MTFEIGPLDYPLPSGVENADAALNCLKEFCAKEGQIEE
ncbi:hypothetical protein Mpsy_2787 [Methanolobus psychrophilus R15]|nr:hypothetical protein Mpsy_2787 [Methanolobus psychrophilus R15]